MTMIKLDLAKDALPALVERVLRGEEIIIVAEDRQIRLTADPVVPKSGPAAARRNGYGVLRGKLELGPQFFEPLSDEDCGLPPDEQVPKAKAPM